LLQPPLADARDFLLDYDADLGIRERLYPDHAGQLPGTMDNPTGSTLELLEDWIGPRKRLDEAVSVLGHMVSTAAWDDLKNGRNQPEDSPRPALPERATDPDDTNKT
jgi:hypothetical protein